MQRFGWWGPDWLRFEKKMESGQRFVSNVFREANIGRNEQFQEAIDQIEAMRTKMRHSPLQVRA